MQHQQHHQQQISVHVCAAFGKDNEIESSELRTYCYYQGSDLSLGRFLARLETTLGSNSLNLLSIVHHTSMLVFHVSSIRSSPPPPPPPRTKSPPRDDSRIMWVYCRKCKESTPTRILPREALLLSFGKFLELLIYSNAFLDHHNGSEDCGGSAGEWYLYFSKGTSDSKVVSIHHIPLTIYTLRLPETRLSMTGPDDDEGSVVVVVEEDDFSSIVAFCLRGESYRSWLDEGAKGEKHYEHQFEIGDTQYYCRSEATGRGRGGFTKPRTSKMFHARSFSDLRARHLGGGDQGYIGSLSSCEPWNAAGGRSRALFCRTKDRRFCIKEMSRIESESFCEFAPSYVQYATLSPDKPLLLAKIFGAYRIVYRNNRTNNDRKLNFIAIENIVNETNEHSIAFDLKGSRRNRTRTETCDRDIVGLDEDYIDWTKHQPVYLDVLSHGALFEALERDSQFLSDNLVMDYSLFACFHPESGSISVGIIDYIRTFTWDKKLETIIKGSAFVGKTAGAKLPTIIEPAAYRKRFLRQMHQYFRVAPSIWYNFESAVSGHAKTVPD